MLDATNTQHLTYYKTNRNIIKTIVYGIDFNKMLDRKHEKEIPLFSINF